MEFVRNSQLLYKLLLVDGIGRSGKVMVAQILTGLHSVEKQEYNEFIEYVSLAYKYQKISQDMAKSILKTQMDAELYNTMIGRNINSRSKDYTSIQKFHSQEKYISRQSLLDGPIVAKRIKEENPIYLNWCHDLIYKSELIFETFGDKLNLIYINRNPIDIIYEWDKKNFGERISNDPTDLTYLVKYKSSIVPEVAIGWEKEYIESKPLERIIKMIYTSMKRNLEMIVKSQGNKNLLIINFEDIVTNPKNFIKFISNYLELDTLPIMNIILAEENCPRELSTRELDLRRNSIVNNLSESFYSNIVQLEKMYLEISSYSKI
jgi:hypothetical protein